MIFQYGQEATDYLRKKDKILGEAIDRIGPIEREIMPNIFEALVNNIVGQQISMKALETVWKRMVGMIGTITPENIAGKSAKEIQACGISMRKAEYIKLAADQVMSGELEIELLYDLPDEAVIERLSELKGIGIWTAEMILIFSMQRANIMSWNDLAIHRGLRMLYHHRRIDKKLFDKYKRRYTPYASVASLYLWEIATGAIPGMKDYAPLSDAEKKRRAKARRRGMLKP
ncbi:DNA-3-methyladenine glycosylase 2 family protein [Oceanobacillus massiliensis]|uniref:DNA-3-methyladenine glycosylase family protein n=1 Tax=Oceanobacillus massiliensis TaxID=1465765 RepID=UPI003017FED7